jgi:hypothetical protein
MKMNVTCLNRRGKLNPIYIRLGFCEWILPTYVSSYNGYFSTHLDLDIRTSIIIFCTGIVWKQLI